MSYNNTRGMRKPKAQYSKYYDPQKRRKQYEENYKEEREYSRQWQKQVADSIFEILGSKCSNPNCAVPGGMTNRHCLQVDHIHGGGNAERERRFGNRFMMLKYYVNHPEEAKAKLQILCANCNWIKRAENKELPVIIEQPRTLVAKKDLETVMPLEAFLSE